MTTGQKECWVTRLAFSLSSMLRYVYNSRWWMLVSKSCGGFVPTRTG